MKENKREFKGIWIPAECWLDKNIKPLKKCLLAEINSLDNENGCTAGNTYFAKFFNISPSRISTLISELAKDGYISVKEEKYQTLECVKTKRIIKFLKWSNVEEPFKNEIPPFKNEIPPFKNEIPPFKNSSYNIINNNIDNNTYNNILSKDNKASSKDAKIIKLSEDTLEYIKYWNTFKNTNKLLFTHILNENNPSKTIILINKYFKFLKNGLIGKYIQLDQEFLKRNNINNNTITFKYENNIIYKILDRLLDLYDSRYWPPNKSNLPRSLSGLIYNPKTGSSFFLKIAQEIFDGKEAQSSIAQQVSEYPKIVEKYSEFAKENSNAELTPTQLNKLNAYIKIFIDFQKYSVKKYRKIYKDTNFSAKIGTRTDPNPFFNTHLSWAKEKVKTVDKMFHPLVIISPHNAFWDSFIKDLKKDEKIDLTLKDVAIRRREKRIQLKDKLEEKNKILEKKQKEQQFFAEM